MSRFEIGPITRRLIESEYREIVVLLEQHYGKLEQIPTLDEVNATIKEPNQYLFLAFDEDNVIIGMTLLIVNQKFARRVGHIEEDVILDGPNKEEIRGELMTSIREFAHFTGVKILDLETYEDRTVDTDAYVRLGMKKKQGCVVYRWRL